MAKPSHNPSAGDEPQYRPDRAQTDPTEPKATERLARDLAHADPDEERARHSVFEEPAILPARKPILIDRDWSCHACGYNLRGLMTGHRCPECGTINLYEPPPNRSDAFGDWFTKKKEQTTPVRSWVVVVALTLLGAPLGLAGTLMTLEQGGVFNAALTGPILVEAAKMVTALILVERWAYLVRCKDQLYVVAMGTAFLYGVVQNIVYLVVLFPGSPETLVAWRWLICVPAHMLLSACAVRGLVPVWERTTEELRRPLIGRALPAMIAAIVLHGAYNAVVVFGGHLGFGM